jgi:hypothetical protein
MGHPAFCPVDTLGALSREVEQQGCAADYLPPSNTNVKNDAAIHSPIVFMAQGLIKHKDKPTHLLSVHTKWPLLCNK